MNSFKADRVEDIEMRLLLEGVLQRYGYDFRDYAIPSLRRRISEAMNSEGVGSVSALQERVLREPACMERLLLTLSINVSDMYRDPGFFRALREKVVPLLRTYPFARIWHAGCSTGEEVYSMAILLMEEGLYDRSRIYATDINERALKTAREGIYPIKAMKKHTKNYIAAGGKREFSEYYTASQDHAVLDPALRQNIVFAEHNLACEGSFNEFQVILCRNVMIYFNRTLQSQVLRLFDESLCPFGVIGLGDKEALNHGAFAAGYRSIDARHRLYQRKH